MLWFDRSQSLVRCEPWFLTGASSREQPWCLDAYFPAPRAREPDHRHVLHGEQDGHYRLGRWASRTTQDLAGEPKSAGAGATNTVRKLRSTTAAGGALMQVVKRDRGCCVPERLLGAKGAAGKAPIWSTQYFQFNVEL